MNPEEPPTQAGSKRIMALDEIEGIDRKYGHTQTTERDTKMVKVSEEEVIKKLHRAIEARDASLVRALLKHKPKLNSPDCGDLLWMAIENPDTEIATMLVHAGTNILTTNKNSVLEPTLLHALAPQADDPNKFELIKLLLHRGARVNQRDKSYNTVLYYAVSKLSDPLRLYKELTMKKRAAVDASVLALVAAKPNYVEYLSCFIWSDNPEHNTDAVVKRAAAIAIDFITEFKGDESLILPAVKWLLELKPPANQLGGRMLDSAVGSGKLEMVKLLIAYGVDVNLKTESGYSAICTALSHKELDMAELLIRNGANINCLSRIFRVQKSCLVYPIHLCCEKGAHEHIQLLLQSGADINLVDGYGMTPFSAIRDHNVLSDAHRVMIKHFLMLQLNGSSVNVSDFEIIYRHNHLKQFTDDCCKELSRMSRSKIINNFSFRSFLTTDIRKITLFMKSQKFRDSFNKYHYRVSFPLYSNEIEWIIKNAMKRKDILAQKEEALIEKLGKFIPDLVIEKIIHHLCLIDA